MLRPVWLQLELFSDLRLPRIEPTDNRSMSDQERDRRTAGQWLRAIHAYLEWQTGDSWRRGSDRNSPERWAYIDAIRCLNEIGVGRQTLALSSRLEIQPSRSTSLDIHIAALAGRSSSALVEELMRLRPELTLRRTLMHLAKSKLARMLLDARNAAAETLRRTA
jgi:hypothetical protein